MSEIKAWLEANQQMVQTLGKWSVVMLAITIVILPAVVVRMPTDYFVTDRRKRRDGLAHPLLSAVFLAVKNVIGVVVIVVGVAMLVLPGQGIITILIGVCLTSFPGKFALVRGMASRPGVSHTLNWIRAKFGQPPFVSVAGELEN